jgi:hypothetical protein
MLSIQRLFGRTINWLLFILMLFISLKKRRAALLSARSTDLASRLKRAIVRRSQLTLHFRIAEAKG